VHESLLQGNQDRGGKSHMRVEWSASAAARLCSAKSSAWWSARTRSARHSGSRPDPWPNASALCVDSIDEGVEGGDAAAAVAPGSSSSASATCSSVTTSRFCSSIETLAFETGTCILAGRMRSN